MAKKDTRLRILKAGEELFSKNGYDGVATKVIASEAGVTEMTLFNHFTNKETLYRTIVKETYLQNEVESVFDQLTYENLEKDLLTIADHLLDSFLGNRNVLLMRFKEKESFQDDDNFKLDHDPIVKQIKPVFKAYQEKDLIRDNDLKTAKLFVASVKGLFYLCTLEDKEMDEVKELIRFHVVTFCNGCTVK